MEQSRLQISSETHLSSSVLTPGSHENHWTLARPLCFWEIGRKLEFILTTEEHYNLLYSEVSDFKGYNPFEFSLPK